MYPFSTRRTVLAAALVASLAACGQGGPTRPSNARPGVVGTSYVVTVYRPTDGTVTSSPPGIHCGPAAADTACSVSFPWSTVVTLTAAPNAGLMFGTWAGDCNDAEPCVLSTAQYGADKYVVAVFGPMGLTVHGNFLDPSVHGWEFKKWVDSKDGAPTSAAVPVFFCTSCHGANYQGAGLAPSCTNCHAQPVAAGGAGVPNFLTKCDFCHGQPPPHDPTAAQRRLLYASPSKNGNHPVLASNAITGCTICHGTTVDGSGNLVSATAGGTHMNGVVEAAGHAVPYPFTQHGPDFIAKVAMNATAECTDCHGTDYGADVGGGKSCNSCHGSTTFPNGPAVAWTSDWKANCTFCHGVKKHDYVAADLNSYAGPPDTIRQRLEGIEELGKSGWHNRHLNDGGFAPAPNYDCSTCHPIFSGFGHIQPGTCSNDGTACGRDADCGAGNTCNLHATVTLSSANAFPTIAAGDLANRNAPFGTYNADGTCTTYCHGAYMADGPPQIIVIPGVGTFTVPVPKVTVKWTSAFGTATTIGNCTDCHGSPPLSGALVAGQTYPAGSGSPLDTRYCSPAGSSCTNHLYHRTAQQQNSYDSCANCHYGSAQGTYYNPANLHVNGQANVVFSGTNVGSVARPVTGTWDMATKTCSNVSCHIKSGAGAHTW